MSQENLSQCIAMLNNLWDRCSGEIDDCGKHGERCFFACESAVNQKICQLFFDRAESLQELWLDELEILIHLSLSIWKEFAKRGKGRDLLWELQYRWQVCAGRLPSPPPFFRDDEEKAVKLKEIIFKLRNFLLGEGYRKEDLGTPPF